MGCAFSQAEDASFVASAAATANVTLPSQLGSAETDLEDRLVHPVSRSGAEGTTADSWLPDDLCLKILAFLLDEDIARAQLVCRQLKSLGDQLKFKRPNLCVDLSQVEDYPEGHCDAPRRRDLKVRLAILDTPICERGNIDHGRLERKMRLYWNPETKESIRQWSLVERVGAPCKYISDISDTIQQSSPSE